MRRYTGFCTGSCGHRGNGCALPAPRTPLSCRSTWLATIGSVSPLLGLLGTVIGVIQAFIGIATKGSGNLSAVAPGVAEALIATAASLAVAIPATFGAAAKKAVTGVGAPS